MFIPSVIYIGVERLSMNMGKVKRISVLMRKIKLVYDLNFNSMQNSYNTTLTVSLQNYYILDVF